MVSALRLRRQPWPHLTSCEPSRTSRHVCCVQLRPDFLYVEGVIKKGGTGAPMCFSSDQRAAMRVC